MMMFGCVVYHKKLWMEDVSSIGKRLCTSFTSFGIQYGEPYDIF